ncbi:MAG: S-layer homology domain-containing protein [Acidimicrobiales bacterium]
MKFDLRRPQRLIAGVLAGAMALTASPLLSMDLASAADALPAAANPLADGAFCDGAPTENPFTDLGGETISTRDTILCLVATDVSTGKTSTTYAPSSSVTRRQMALFIKRLADLANALETSGLTALPTYDGSPDYTDLDAESSLVRQAVGQLSQAGIVTGTSATRYSPSGLVSRRQMAAFVNRLQEFLTGAPFTATGDYFDDDDGDSGEDNLNAMAERGIFQGDGAGNVFPGASLTRRQMALILMRDGQVMLDDGDVERPFSDSNQTITVTPTDATTLTWFANPEVPSRSGDDREYVASGLTAATTYKIALFPAHNITTVNGRLVFADADGTPNRADGPGSTAAGITVVNGAANASDVASAQPINGDITFQVDGDSSEESLIPVVWLDQGAYANELDLTGPSSSRSPKEPSEAFGVGGVTNYVPIEATLGTHGGVTVASANIANNYFTSSADTTPHGPETFHYDVDDVFQYQGTGITLAQFESMISNLDTVTVIYEPEPADASTFNITADSTPSAPAISGVVVRNLDGDAQANDVEVTFTPPFQNSAGTIYTLQRASVGNDLNTNTCGGDNDVAATTGWIDVSATSKVNADGTHTLTNSNVAGGCYDYRVKATNPSSPGAGAFATGTSWVTTNDNGVEVAGAAATAPTSTYMTSSNGTGTAVPGTLDKGDTITVVFSKTMGAPVDGDKIRFTDADGTVMDVICGALKATCTLDGGLSFVGGALRAANTVIELDLLADPTPLDPPQPGTVSDLQIASAAAMSQTGFADTTDNAWNIAGSSDKSLA